MSVAYKTDQETFWAGEFGDAYADRNQGNRWIASNTALFSKILHSTHGIESVLELGANVGLNLHALQNVLPQAQLSAVEINSFAAAQLRQEFDPDAIFEQSILEFVPTTQYDLAFSKGVLIHIDPASLPAVYDCLYKSSRKYVLIAEYYNPTPVEISYRGHQGKLFKRDFAGEFLDRFDNVRLLDYGFAYHRDVNFPQDDISWFLMEKVV
jgi:spore coat polysaccharide biosynthesis protein SpsF